MGHSVGADVVPFVLHDILVVGHCDSWDHLTEEQAKLIDPENWASGFLLPRGKERDFLEENPHREAVARGWKIHLFTDNPKHEDIDFGKKERIWAHVWRKGDHMVGIMNESEYCDIGEVHLSIVANDRASIEAFKKDFELPGEIEENDSVTQAG